MVQKTPEGTGKKTDVIRIKGVVQMSITCNLSRRKILIGVANAGKESPVHVQVYDSTAHASAL